MKAIDFINSQWPDNKIPLPIKEQWAELIEKYHNHQQRNLLIDYETWKTENDIKNLLPEQLADFYIESN